MPGSEHERRLETALLSDGHGQPALLARNGRVQQCNRPAQALLGSDPTGRSLHELLDQTSAEKLDRIASAANGAHRTEVQIVRPDEEPRAVSFLVLQAGEGELLLLGSPAGASYPQHATTRLMSTIDELTVSLRELSRRASGTRAVKESLEQINEARELFVTALAHDLRTPLNAVLLCESVVERSAQAGTAVDLEQHSQQVARNVRLAIELIDSVVLADRLDAQEPHLDRERVRLDVVAEQWIETFMPLATSSDVTLAKRGRWSVEVRGDRIRLGEVFSNLLANAIRHSPAGGRIEIGIDLDRDAEQVVCSVADEGPGVPGALRRAIFEKFAQGRAARGVSGLGLYICRRVIELHGGRIWVEDNVPRGAKFVFTLPGLL